VICTWNIFLFICRQKVESKVGGFPFFEGRKANLHGTASDLVQMGERRLNRNETEDHVNFVLSVGRLLYSVLENTACLKKKKNNYISFFETW
jgi:hypothetical protein